MNWYTATSFLPSSEKEQQKGGVKILKSKFATCRNGPVKSTEKGRNENTKRLIVEKRGKKNTLHLLHMYMTQLYAGDVE